MSKIRDKMLKLDQWMVAVTFAEAGERNTALEIMNETPGKEIRKRVHGRVCKREDNRPVMRA
ncbi:MAG: hypothetical protein HY788_09060 [Deltaproteobacteria bacterium]|nr:hypothetical protein [Deltaproteobacteria bacterium]